MNNYVIIRCRYFYVCIINVLIDIRYTYAFNALYDDAIVMYIIVTTRYHTVCCTRYKKTITITVYCITYIYQLARAHVSARFSRDRCIKLKQPLCNILI